MASSTWNYSRAERRPAVRAVQSLGFVTGVWACVALVLSFAAGVLQRTTNPPAIYLSERINPNDAPAASLARLPGVGPARARAIIAYRDRIHGRAGRRPAFRNAGDLQQIRGIGPATVTDLERWLRFDRPFRDSNTPSER